MALTRAETTNAETTDAYSASGVEGIVIPPYIKSLISELKKTHKAGDIINLTGNTTQTGKWLVVLGIAERIVRYHDVTMNHSPAAWYRKRVEYVFKG